MRPKNIKHEVLPIMYFSKKKAKIKECEKDDFSYLLFFQVFWEEKNKKKEKTQRNISLSKGPTRKEHSFCWKQKQLQKEAIQNTLFFVKKGE